MLNSHQQSALRRLAGAVAAVAGIALCRAVAAAVSTSTAAARPSDRFIRHRGLRRGNRPVHRRAPRADMATVATECVHACGRSGTVQWYRQRG